MFLLVLLKKVKSEKSHNPNFHGHSLEQEDNRVYSAAFQYKPLPKSFALVLHIV